MRVLALTDVSLYGRSVADHAAWISKDPGNTIDLVNIVATNELLARSMAVQPGGAMIMAGDLAHGTEVADLRHRGGEMLAEVKLGLVARGFTDVRTMLEEGIVADKAVAAAANADLVVLGKRGEHADLARLPLGYNVQRITRLVDKPVLVVSRQFRPILRCVLAFDRDEATMAAIQALAVQGVVRPMPILLLHAGQDNDELRLTMQAAEGVLRGAGFEVTVEVVDGDPQRVIPQRVVTSDADLVIMGAFSRSRLKTFFFGSLTAEVMRACQTPVLLFHGDGHEPEGS